MKIGIDIDDTTFLTVKSMLKYADIFEEEISGVPTNRDSFGLIKDRYYLKVLYEVYQKIQEMKETCKEQEEAR